MIVYVNQRDPEGRADIVNEDTGRNAEGRWRLEIVYIDRHPITIFKILDIIFFNENLLCKTFENL